MAVVFLDNTGDVVDKYADVGSVEAMAVNFKVLSSSGISGVGLERVNSGVSSDSPAIISCEVAVDR